MATIDNNTGVVTDDGPTWQDVREGNIDTPVEVDDNGNPIATVSVSINPATAGQGNLIGLLLLGAALYFLSRES